MGHEAKTEVVQGRTTSPVAPVQPIPMPAILWLQLLLAFHCPQILQAVLLVMNDLVLLVCLLFSVTL